MAEINKPIVHGVYSVNLDRLDENGDQAYAIVYLENDINDVQLVPLEEIEDLDNLPAIDFTTDSLKTYLENINARFRIADRDKLDKTEATKVATPNKLLYLDNASKLQATAINSDKLGNVDYTEYALKTDVEASEWQLDDVKVSQFTPITNLDSIPEVIYSSATLLEFSRTNEAKIRKLDRDKINKSDAKTTATPNKLLYLNASGKLDATATNADKLGNIDAALYALKSDIPEMTTKDISLEGLAPLADDQLDKIPTINYTLDNLEKFSQVIEARTRKLDRDKVNKLDTVTTAAPNKLLYLNASSKLDATATNADKLGNYNSSEYWRKDEMVEMTVSEVDYILNLNGDQIQPTDTTYAIMSNADIDEIFE